MSLKNTVFNIIETSEKDIVYRTMLDMNNKDWAKTIAAFANSGGGSLVVGVDDEGMISGLDPEETARHQDLVTEAIDRHLSPSIETAFAIHETAAAKGVLCVAVAPSRELVVFRDEGNEEVYIRSRGDTVKATIEQIVHLGNRKFGTDERILNKTFVKKNFSRYFRLVKKNRTDGKQPSTADLIKEKIITEDERITEGFNMFADDYDDENISIVCRIWKAYEKNETEDHKEAEFFGPLGEIYSDTLKYLQKNTRKGLVRAKDGSRIETPSYPETALKEALINAIAHRDYSLERTPIEIDVFKDRIRISSPGPWLLYGDLSRDQAEEIPSIQRNRVICSCLQLAGLMENRGLGLRKISEAYKDFRIKEPVYESTDDSFIVTICDLLDNEEALPAIAFSKRGEEVLKYCLDEPKSRNEIQEHLVYRSRQHFTTDILDPLLKSGLLTATEPKHSKKQRYITNSERYSELFKEKQAG